MEAGQSLNGDSVAELVGMEEQFVFPDQPAPTATRIIASVCEFEVGDYENRAASVGKLLVRIGGTCLRKPSTMK